MNKLTLAITFFVLMALTFPFILFLGIVTNASIGALSTIGAGLVVTFLVLGCVFLILHFIE